MVAEKTKKRENRGEMTHSQSPERGPQGHGEAEHPATSVTQPKRAEALQQFIANLDESVADIGKPREGESNAIAEQWSGAGNDGTMQAAGGTMGMSPRDRAIAAIPLPVAMQRELEKHIQREVRNLRREARHIVRLGRPGTAFQLNQLYARIRRLNALLHEIYEASIEVLKRLFIRVFIDRQPIL